MMLEHELGRHRLFNGLQTLLILGGLTLTLSLPGYLLAGPGGVLMSLSAVIVAALLTSWVPARMILARAGAERLPASRAPELHALLARFYAGAGLTIEPRLYYAPSPDLNAFAVGGPHDGGIAVTDGLLRSLTLRELGGVLAHEVSHLRRGDTRVMSIAAAMTRMTLWLTTAVQLAILISLPMMLTDAGGLPWLSLLAIAVAPTLSVLLSLALSRNREYTADLEAVALTGDPAGLASALVVLERRRSGWLMSLFGRRPAMEATWLRTHPSTEARIRRLSELDGGPDSPHLDETDTPTPTPRRPAPHPRAVRHRWH
ncbi:zinc metalloprotease HtpX [Halomonas getboli]|uniref:zinc metalloprotease HtpX n=1 Tax=Halomonas getboli TaxID=2935862 RepID=UPI001FFF8C84|nr:zinc metalloprotease HtpX [Halomonas getboli]MCK2182427.1 zinc metalloprotease HtpX [Halomonas getboli]